MRPFLLQACLNGTRRPDEHPALPLSPAEVGRAARRSMAAGASTLHVHPRGVDGEESLEPAAVGATVASLRHHCPGTSVGVTTGAWIEPDVGKRLDLVARWELLPDYASVNLTEDGALELCALLLERGIGVEAGIWVADDARTLAGSDVADRCLRVLLEPMDGTAEEAIANAEEMLAVLDDAGITVPRLLHSADDAAWPVLEAAVAWGLDTRTGLEDVLVLPDGSDAHGNAQLVAAAWEIAKAAGRV